MMTDIEKQLYDAARRLAVECQNDHTAVYLEVDSRGRAEWMSYASGGSHIRGCSMEEVIQKQVDAMSPGNRAMAIRLKAEKLLAEAAKLEGLK